MIFLKPCFLPFAFPTNWNLAACGVSSDVLGDALAVLRRNLPALTADRHGASKLQLRFLLQNLSTMLSLRWSRSGSAALGSPWGFWACSDLPLGPWARSGLPWVPGSLGVLWAVMAWLMCLSMRALCPAFPSSHREIWNHRARPTAPGVHHLADSNSVTHV